MSGRLALRGGAVAVLGALAGLFAGALAIPTGRTWLELLLAVGAITLAAAVGYLGLRESSRAVEDVSLAARRLASGDMGERVAISLGPAAGLTQSFNAMARQLQALLATVAAEEARLRAVFDASSDPMIAVTADTTVCFLNSAAERIFGLAPETGLNRPFIEIARDFELDGLLRRAIADGQEGATEVITFGQKRTPLRAAALPIRDGAAWSVLLTLTDLTEVQRVDQVRRDFLSNVSHELRTPLAAIRALVETIESGAVEPGEETDAFLARVRQQVDRLTLLVSELLDLSRIESGAVELVPEPVDLSQLFAEASSLMRHRLDAEELRTEFDSGPMVVEGDRSALLRVVCNLVDNAIKFSPRGGTIRASARDEGDLVAFEVRDEGPGIAESDLPRVFERFYKGDASRANSGVGLGLAIVKHIVRAHGGTAAASSPPGAGAVFTVRLPRHFVATSPSLSRTA
jgi:two-component system phosphate regulon sensor histidine kinase PhoR